MIGGFAALRRPIGDLALAGLLTAGAWFAARDAVNRVFVASHPERAAALWPAGGDALAQLALKRIVAAGGAPDATASERIARALRRAPASAAPLALAAFDAAARGDLARTTRLMEAARRRDPRLALARAWLFTDYARTGRLTEALGEVGPLSRLVPETRPKVFVLVAQIAARPGGEQALRAAWARDPAWRPLYVQWLRDRRPVAVTP